jgi:hypothetical protein
MVFRLWQLLVMKHTCLKRLSLTKIMTKLDKCKYRIGLTGTLDGTKTHNLVLEGLFGTVNKVVSTSELQEVVNWPI